MYCPRCNKEISKETNKELIQKYPYVCLNCDENFFQFELNTETDLENGKQNNR